MPFIGEVICALVDVTREGKLQEWGERIGRIAKMARVPDLEEVEWHGAPKAVASHVIRLALTHGKTQELERAIQEYKDKADEPEICVRFI